MSWLKKLDLIGWIKDKLRPIKEIRVAEPGMEFKHFMRFLDEATRERMNKLEAENAKLRGQVAERDESKLREKQIDEAREEALAQSHAKKYTLALRFFINDGEKTVEIPHKLLPNFFYRSGRGHEERRKLKGFFLRENTSGGLEFMPWLTGSKDRMFMASSPTFKDFFANKAHIVTQLIEGKADTNFMKDEGEIPLFKGDSGEKTKDEEISRLERDMAKKSSTISQLDDALKKSQRRESYLQSMIANLQGRVKSETDLAGTMTASSRELHHELSGYARDVANAARATSGLQISHAVSDENMRVMSQSLESVRSKLLKMEANPIRKEVLGDIKEMLAYLSRMEAAQTSTRAQQFAQMMPKKEVMPPKELKPPAKKKK